ncbi:hypothetical protein TEA_007451 [Camellia sinensis var. sinensis]|uniref:Uncharacterized protein n=1 Tax=Camellia sinensis var. sinensis TaxID=542762 RepID=A0A4V3WMQ8_CAMSN|nr:hypothetical protein TEA_007451 [Camellia sinensis var. sinensis]
MGKSLPRAATTKLQQKLTDHLIKTPKRSKPISQNRLVSPETPRFCCELRRPKSEKKMENKKSSSSSTRGGGAEEQNHRTPLSRVVSDCAKRWFQDTLKDAKAGDVSMQGRIWMTRASRIRSSVWKVSNKRPGLEMLKKVATEISVVISCSACFHSYISSLSCIYVVMRSNKRGSSALYLFAAMNFPVT